MTIYKISNNEHTQIMFVYISEYTWMYMYNDCRILIDLSFYLLGDVYINTFKWICNNTFKLHHDNETVHYNLKYRWPGYI